MTARMKNTTDIDDEVLAVVREAAAAGAKCPSNRFLANAIGVTEHYAQCALVRLDQRGAIKITRRIPPFRKIEVPGVGETGWNCRVKEEGGIREVEVVTNIEPWVGDCFAAHNIEPGDHCGSVSRPETLVPRCGALA